MRTLTTWTPPGPASGTPPGLRPPPSRKPLLAPAAGTASPPARGRRTSPAASPPTPPPGRLGWRTSAARRRPRRGRRSTGGSTTAPRPGDAAGPAAGPGARRPPGRAPRGDRAAGRGRGVRRRPAADPTLPGQVVQTDVFQSEGVGSHVEQAREVPLQTDGDVAQPDRPVARLQQGAGDDADRVGEVDDPCVGVGRAHAVGDVQHHGHRPQRLRQTAGTRGLLPHAAAVQWPRLVTVSCRLATDPQLEQDRVRSVDRVVEAVGGAHRPGWPWWAKMRRARPPTSSRRSSAGSMRTSSSTGRSSRNRANPSMSSGVYVEPPPMTASFNL